VWFAAELSRSRRAVDVGAPNARYFTDPGCGACGENYDVTLRLPELDETLCQQARNCCLWTADVAEAVFVDVAIGEEVQFIHHVVMTTYKRPVNPGRLQYR
jgi:hypothetical protein